VGARGELKSIHSGIEKALGNEGFPPDPRFHPHITIGRVKKIEPAGRIELAERIEGLKDFKVGDFTAESFELMKSTLTPEGPIYEVLKSFKL
jgi:2'-5' RNA ligase